MLLKVLQFFSKTFTQLLKKLSLDDRRKVDMNKVDKICKDSRLMVDSIKDVVEVNVVSTLQAATGNINEPQVQNLLKVISTSIEEGYNRSFNVFRRSVETSLTEVKNKKS